MVWINASARQPEDKEEVLIRVETIVHLAEYDETENVFRLRNGQQISLSGHRIEWMRLSTPETENDV
jgi:hypothetical protein